MFSPERFHVSIPPSAIARSGPTRRQRLASPSRITASRSSADATSFSTSHAHSRTSANWRRFQTNPGTSRRTTIGSLPSEATVSLAKASVPPARIRPRDHLDGRHEQGRIEVVGADVRSGAPIASPIAVIENEEVFVATTASGGDLAHLAETAFSSSCSGSDSTTRSAPSAACAWSRASGDGHSPRPAPRGGGPCARAARARPRRAPARARGRARRARPRGRRARTRRRSGLPSGLPRRSPRARSWYGRLLG